MALADTKVARYPCTPIYFVLTVEAYKTIVTALQFPFLYNGKVFNVDRDLIE